jgi:hypothetical protein
VLPADSRQQQHMCLLRLLPLHPSSEQRQQAQVCLSLAHQQWQPKEQQQQRQDPPQAVLLGAQP